MFPLIDAELRPKLKAMMDDKERNTYGSMDFQVMIKQFLELQSGVRMNRERIAVYSAGFTGAEVGEFRELFEAADEDDDEEMTWSDIKKHMGNVCTLEGKQPAVFHQAFQEARTS